LTVDSREASDIEVSSCNRMIMRGFFGIRAGRVKLACRPGEGRDP
jgi:hypothetical protein